MASGGRTIRLSPPRRVILDMLDFAKAVPNVPVQKRISVRRILDVRRKLVDRPGWSSIFVKAFALVSIETPPLRRVFVPGWRPYLFESDSTVAMIATERLWNGEPVVFLARISRPEILTVHEIDARIRRFQNDPIESIGPFRRMILLGRMPRFLRRWILRRRTSGAGRKRVERSGTFGVSVYSALGAESLHPLAPVTCLLNYGVIDENGEVVARIVYDHRVLDGAVVARALNRLEEVLNDDIADSLISPPNAASSPNAPMEASNAWTKTTGSPNPVQGPFGIRRKALPTSGS